MSQDTSIVQKDIQGGPQLYLASASVRRRELLKQINIEFELLGVVIDESVRDEETPLDYVARVALGKARAGLGMMGTRPPHPVLGADTAVVVDEHILGKPRDRDHALEMLALLSGREHQVYSAVALIEKDREIMRVHVSRVVMRQFSEAEREAYWETGECLDKAGAYAIQGFGATLISEIQGSYSGVMGLPLFETAELLTEMGITVLGSSD